MTLREEVKDIYDNRPTRSQRMQEREEQQACHRKRTGLLPKRKACLIALILMFLIASAFLVMLVLVNAFPPDLTITLVVIMMAILVGSGLLLGSPRRQRRISGLVLSLVFAVLFLTATSFLGSTYAMMNKISSSSIGTGNGPVPDRVKVAEEPFNIYITGIDQWAAEKGEDLERSDVNMIVTVNPRTKKILLTSIPRDTYVKLHTAQQMDKLTHTGVYGVDETLNTVEDWLGIDINYYVKMNFTGACAVVDAVDGIDVYSPVAFESSIDNYSFDKGWNHLYGRAALYFARERHAFEGEDSDRVENQQRVMKALIKKLTSSTTLLTHYGDIMKAAGDNLETNMSESEMKDLIKLQVAELAKWDVETQKIEGEYDQDYVASLTQSMKFDVYRPSYESVRNCTNNINETINPSRRDIKEANQKRNKSFFINAIKMIFKREE